MRTPRKLLATTALAWLLGRDVRAAGASDWLRWRAPAGCPDAADVERRVAALLGGGSASAAVDLRVAGEVRRDGPRWVLRLVARRAGGAQRRRLHHEDCAVLGEAAALLVALAVDPTAVVIDPRIASLLRPTSGPARPPPPSVAPVLREPAPSAVTPTIAAPDPPPDADRSGRPPPLPPVPDPVRVASPIVPPPRTPAPPRPASRTWPALRVIAGVATGATPGVSAVIGAAAALGIGRRARVELTANYSPPTRTHLAVIPTAGAAISLASGGLRGCGVPGRSLVEVPLCLGLELGSSRATGFGVDEPRTTRSLWAALAVGAALVVVPTPRLALWLGLDGQLALARPRFLITHGGEVWRSDLLGLRASLGVEVRLRAPGRPAP